MADNFISYQRFAALPPDISKYGVTKEELTIQNGKPDPNPALSPMPDNHIPETRLGLRPHGSDAMRLTHPTGPEVNPHEGPQSKLSWNRKALRKMSGQIMKDIEELIDSGAIGDEALGRLMRDSLDRVDSLVQYLTQLNKMTEMIYVRSITSTRS